MSSPPPRPSTATAVVLAWDGDEEPRERCLRALREHAPPATQIVAVAATCAALDASLADLAPCDVVVLLEPCEVDAGWLDRLHAAAHADTNIATASAFADAGELAVGASQAGDDARAGAQRPRLTRAAGPCVYVRRDALELVGGLDHELPPAPALTIDFTQRCLLAGLWHVAAPDVRVRSLAGGVAEPDATILEDRYPYLQRTPLAASDVLDWTLANAGTRAERISVTVDARALQGLVTGTQVHILELVLALAATDALRLRLLVWGERIDAATLALLAGLDGVELLDVADAGAAAPSAVFHRPQQTFAHEDVALAAELGERVVLSQLDLIAYDNPGYFADAAAWRSFRQASRRGLALADRVLVFSEHTRRELLGDALVEEERLDVVAPGLDHRLAPPLSRPTALDGERPFLLCLGTDFRHKNRLFALRVAAALQERHAWAGRLVFAGTHVEFGSSRAAERELLAADTALASTFIDLGAVSEAEKAWLMRNAAAVLYPSTYEGFGLVPFEAALGGVPCLFAAQASLADVTPPETAAIPPWDPAASADALQALLADPAQRARQVDALARVARELTWAATAARIVPVYEHAMIAPPRSAARASRDAAARERELAAVQQREVDALIGEREQVLRDYNEQITSLGPARTLVGPSGALPEDIQRMLLALSARPALARPVLRSIGALFALGRAIARLAGRGSR